MVTLVQMNVNLDGDKSLRRKGCDTGVGHTFIWRTGKHSNHKL